MVEILRVAFPCRPRCRCLWWWVVVCSAIDGGETPDSFATSKAGSPCTTRLQTLLPNTISFSTGSRNFIFLKTSLVATDISFFPYQPAVRDTNRPSTWQVATQPQHVRALAGDSRHVISRMAIPWSSSYLHWHVCPCRCHFQMP